MDKLVIFSANIGGGTFYPTPTSNQNSVQVLTTQTVWTVSQGPTGGMLLSVNGQYLTTQTVFLQYKNYCLVTSPNVAQAAEVMPYWTSQGVYLKLMNGGNVLTLDTRGYVTQFEPLQGGNGYPYFQYLMTQTVGESGEAAASPAAEHDFVEDPNAVAV